VAVLTSEHKSCSIVDLKAVRAVYVCVSKSFRIDRLERELQMVQLSASRCSFIAILWVSLVSFAAITLYVASQRVFIVVVYFVINSVRNFWINPRILMKSCDNWNTNTTMNRVLVRTAKEGVIPELWQRTEENHEIFQLEKSPLPPARIQTWFFVTQIIHVCQELNTDSSVLLLV
jgi:hypothetical protein